MNQVMENLAVSARRSIHKFLEMHSLAPYRPPLSGEFCLKRGFQSPDLYGMVDAVYALYSLGELAAWTSKASRARWAARILSCQDEKGWFTKGNKKGHPKEHATAYAIGALCLLEVEEDEQYMARLRPIDGLFPLLKDPSYVTQWLERLDFRWHLGNILEKNLGWHYIWRGSHIGGGIAAIIGMLEGVLNESWGWKVDVEIWFRSYFEWLDQHVNPETGYWQRSFWNSLWKRPTVIDMGGAAHFYWIYEAKRRPFPYPEAVIKSTLHLQKQNGLYKEKPFCIDLDGNFLLIRSYRQLAQDKQEIWRDKVLSAVNRSGKAILKFLSGQNIEQVYPDLHYLPGAIVGLIECSKTGEASWVEILSGWKHPLDKVMWL
jgi:hypothetical protein